MLIKFEIINFDEDMLNEKGELSKSKYKGKSIRCIHHMYTFMCMLQLQWDNEIY